MTKPEVQKIESCPFGSPLRHKESFGAPVKACIPGRRFVLLRHCEFKMGLKSEG